MRHPLRAHSPRSGRAANWATSPSSPAPLSETHTVGIPAIRGSPCFLGSNGGHRRRGFSPLALHAAPCRAACGVQRRRWQRCSGHALGQPRCQGIGARGPCPTGSTASAVRIGTGQFHQPCRSRLGPSRAGRPDGICDAARDSSKRTSTAIVARPVATRIGLASCYAELDTAPPPVRALIAARNTPCTPDRATTIDIFPNSQPWPIRPAVSARDSPSPQLINMAAWIKVSTAPDSELSTAAQTLVSGSQAKQLRIVASEAQKRDAYRQTIRRPPPIYADLGKPG